MYRAISAMFKCPKSRVILSEEHKTDYFNCTIGVKQGDSISPTLFACFLNCLSQEITAMDLGVKLSNNNNNNKAVAMKGLTLGLLHLHSEF